MKNTKDEKSQSVGETSESKRQTLDRRVSRHLNVQMGRPDGLEWEQKTDGKNRIQYRYRHAKITAGFDLDQAKDRERIRLVSRHAGLG